ncbi:LysR family transcriptional regulator [Diplocloster agilis]|uniref:LysR family transcriptional regulator n=1 Tax=Diplocloster agilis TaxID=2850323 RepID=A0A949K654_9FIRM|nr:MULTISPECIES: LysR family transcriptional regulator [Lachnospiraceae]MBU9738111.1 LysR family transcriptional regulator [Diplocloster agilis]MBU9742631.1 LysR family transcriptional regulator [Diplocloster agilis]MCU6734485.1 LysR family transcriptional regulator [Suonthocola fibrivorans]SCJ41577.1 Cyn operon transcriptional activator [uncultured Clostridium sp.]
MELRVLNYFLEVAREGSITGAAKVLHISQPTLSKQLKDLEYELGSKLFVRSNYSVKLTDEGILLRKRAEDILEMANKTLEEFSNLNDITGGDVRIGCAESCHIKYLADVIKDFRVRYPGLRFHIKSGDTRQVTEDMERGLSDFAVIVEPPDLSKYNYLTLPEADVWGLLMPSDSPLAKKSAIQVEDLSGLPLIVSRQALKVDLPRWCGEKLDDLNVIGSTNLFYNGSVCVKTGLCYMLTFDRLADVSAESGLCFRPLSPVLKTQMFIIWKKYQVFTPIAEKLVEELKNRFANV